MTGGPWRGGENAGRDIKRGRETERDRELERDLSQKMDGE